MSRKTFAEAPGGRENNLCLMKFLAALLVIFTHAFPITGSGVDFLKRWSGGQCTFGELGISVFFFCGGFLILKSLEGKSGPDPRKTARVYFRARCLRIFPLLWVVVAACVFLMGPLMTTRSFGGYFADPGTWKYLLNGLLIPVHPLPGVFEGNPFPEPTVNGSLWTLPVEFVCYVLCWLFFRAGFAGRDRKTLLSLPLVAAGTAAVYVFFWGNTLLLDAVPEILLFFLGMQAYLWKEKIPQSYGTFGAAVVLLALSLRFGFYGWARFLCLPVILMTLAFGIPPFAARFGRRRELSYGIYLTAWPVQQILCQLFPGIGWAGNTAGAAVICILLSVPLTAVEKKMLRRLEPGVRSE